MQMQYVCFNISSLCDMSCPYCYRVGNSFGNVSYKSAIEYIDYLISNGCTAINITGGEPLLNPDWKRIIASPFRRDRRSALSAALLLRPDKSCIRRRDGHR